MNWFRSPEDPVLLQLVDAQRLGPCPLMLKTTAVAAAAAAALHSFWLVFLFQGPGLKISSQLQSPVSNPVYLNQLATQKKKPSRAESKTITKTKSNFVKARPHVTSKQQNQWLKAVLL